MVQHIPGPRRYRVDLITLIAPMVPVGYPVTPREGLVDEVTGNLVLNGFSK